MVARVAGGDVSAVTLPAAAAVIIEVSGGCRRPSARRRPQNGRSRWPEYAFLFTLANADLGLKIEIGRL
jgi:hypothetical protein